MIFITAFQGHTNVDKVAKEYADSVLCVSVRV